MSLVQYERPINAVALVVNVASLCWAFWLFRRSRSIWHIFMIFVFSIGTGIASFSVFGPWAINTYGKLTHSEEKQSAKMAAMHTRDARIIHLHGSACPEGWQRVEHVFHMQDGREPSACYSPGTSGTVRADYLEPGEAERIGMLP